MSIEKGTPELVVSMIQGEEWVDVPNPLLLKESKQTSMSHEFVFEDTTGLQLCLPDILSKEWSATLQSKDSDMTIKFKAEGYAIVSIDARFHPNIFMRLIKRTM